MNLNNIISLLHQFVKETTKELNLESVYGHRKGQDHAEDWQDGYGPDQNIAGPLMLALKSLVTQCSSILSKALNHKEESKHLLDGIKRIKEELNHSISSIENQLVYASKQTNHLIYQSYLGKDALYVGNVDEDGLKDGEGCLIFENEFYRGEWSEGSKNGIGFQMFYDGSKYNGLWEEGRPKIGFWTLPDGTEFRGYRKLGEDGYFSDWMIGLKSTDKFDGVSSILYHKNEKTNTSNLVMEQNVDIEALRGELHPPRRATIRYLNGVTYDGYFDDFEPLGIGTLTYDSPKSSIKIAQFSELGEEGEQMEEIQMAEKTQKKINIFISWIRVVLFPHREGENDFNASDFKRSYVILGLLNTNYYEGWLNSNLDFEGFAHIGNKDNEAYPGFYGLFSTNGVVLYEFESQGEWEKQIDFLKELKIGYFLDSEKYISEEGIDIEEYPWLKLRILYMKESEKHDEYFE